jgi:uncharacterized Tic20 family protein
VQKFKNLLIRCFPAPEAEDIIWENIEKSKKEKRQGRMKSHLFTFFSLILGFGIILGVSIWQEASSGSSLSLFITILTSLIILIVN